MGAPRGYRFRTFLERDGRPVRLSMARWRHILKKHPDISEEQLQLTLAEPDAIENGRESQVYRRRDGPRTVFVAVRNVRGLYIRTAYFSP